MTTKTNHVTIEALTDERDRLVTQQGQTKPGSVEYWSLTAELAQVAAELARRELPEREQTAKDAVARVEAMRPKVAELLATYEAAKRAAEEGPGAAYRSMRYELSLAIERARYADGNRGELAQARGRLAAATRTYHDALTRKEAAEEQQRRQEAVQLEARAERDRREARQQQPVLPEVPAPDLSRLVAR